jgi:hypothetical protein
MSNFSMKELPLRYAQTIRVETEEVSSRDTRVRYHRNLRRHAY